MKIPCYIVLEGFGGELVVKPKPFATINHEEAIDRAIALAEENLDFTDDEHSRQMLREGTFLGNAANPSNNYTVSVMACELDIDPRSIK